MVPVEFLSDEQAAAYGRFLGEPAREQLERFFWLNDADLARIGRRRRDATALGYAVQLGTVRFLGGFLVDPLDVPWSVVVFVAGQLGIVDPSCVKDYGSRPMTAHEHQWDIRREYGTATSPSGWASFGVSSRRGRGCRMRARGPCLIGPRRGVWSARCCFRG